MYTGGIHVIKFQGFFFPANLVSAKKLEEETSPPPPLQQQNRKIEIGDKRMEDSEKAE